MQWSYDNAAANQRHPNAPPARVVAGNRAQDEMGHLWLQVLPRPEAGDAPGGDARILLQEALMRARLLKYPGDFTALYNLGAALQIEGRLEEAMTQPPRTAASNPANPTARNSLVTAQPAPGDLDGAPG